MGAEGAAAPPFSIYFLYVLRVVFCNPLKDASHVLWEYGAMFRSLQDIFRPPLSEFLDPPLFVTRAGCLMKKSNATFIYI